MAIDKTTITVEKDSYIVERNHACKPIGIQEPVNDNSGTTIEPAVCFDQNGKPIMTKDGNLPVLMPRTLRVPRNEPLEKVMKRAESMKNKEKECKACARVKDKIESGEIQLSSEQKVDKKYEPLFRNFPRLEKWRPGIVIQNF